MDLSGRTLQELTELKNQISNLIYNYEDGFFYICKVSSFGRNWTENHNNSVSTAEFCYNYNGDDGIVTVYTNNPDCDIHSYGGVYYIKSKDDLKKWEDHRRLKNMVPRLEKQLEEWDNADNVPFMQRGSYFKPHTSKEELQEYKDILENYIIDFDEPKPFGCVYED